MEKNSQIRCPKPSPAHWMSHSIGRGDIHLNSIISTWNSVTGSYGPEIRVELVLTGECAQEHFDALEQKQAEIEGAIGSPLTWHNPIGKKQRKIYVRQDADFLQEALWPQQDEWFRSKLELFKKVFGPILQKLDVEDAQAASQGGQS